MGKKILVVDDEPDMVEWMEAYFEDNGFETSHAYNGFDGFAKAKAEIPDLITLDVTMEKESGVRMYKNLRETEETKKIPVIMITGVAPEFKKFIGERRNIPAPNAYFEKPVDRDVLLKKIQELMGT